MDNKLNEIRKQISDLRAEMAALEEQIRFQVMHDMECSEASVRLMAMRQQVTALIRQRDALGGAESCPSIAERLARSSRTAVVGKRIGRR